MTKCVKCGGDIMEGAKFCSYCGAPVEQKKFCISCGKEIPNDASFCPNCGANQNAGAAANNIGIDMETAKEVFENPAQFLANPFRGKNYFGVDEGKQFVLQFHAIEKKVNIVNSDEQIIVPYEIKTEKKSIVLGGQDDGSVTYSEDFKTINVDGTIMTLDTPRFSVTLESFMPAKKMAIMQVLRSETGLGLGDIKSLLENTPAIVKKEITQVDAGKLVTKLSAAGGNVKISE